MKQIVLNCQLSDHALENMIRRYHFNDTDFLLSKKIYQRIRSLSEVKVFYKITTDIEMDRVTDVEINVGHDKSVICVMTLGNALDKLQDEYHALGKELEVYLIECLAMFILEQSYTEFEHVISQETGLCLKQIKFPDIEEKGKDYHLRRGHCKTQEISMIEIVDQLSRQGMTDVIYNQAGVLIPKKSVVFYSTLGESHKDVKTDHSANICEQCSNKECTNRKKRKK